MEIFSSPMEINSRYEEINSSSVEMISCPMEILACYWQKVMMRCNYGERLTKPIQLSVYITN